MPNVVTYCRVSSEEQALKDISIPAQRKLLRQWVETQPDHHVLEDFVDEGQSAYAPADRRPGFCAMITFCRRNEVDTILVHKLDRFSRNREESILFKGLLRKHGVTVKSITEHYDPETPQGFLYEGMIEVINQFYSMNLATETLKGMRENAERGYVNGGAIPYGYRKAMITDAHGREHGQLVFGPDAEVETVRLIFDLAVNHGLGGKSVAAELNRRKIPGPRSPVWNAATISHILNNPTYVGDKVWFKTKRTGRDSRAKTDASDHIVTRDSHPAMVDRGLHEKYRALAVNRRFDVEPNPDLHVKYLLGRLIRCENCGGNFVGRRHHYVNRKTGEKQLRTAYYCNSYLTKGKSVCKPLPIDQAWIEGFVIDQIRKRLEGQGWEEVVAATHERIEARRSKYGTTLSAVQGRVAEIDRKIQNFIRAIGDGLDPAVCRPQIDELNAQKEKLLKESTVLAREDYYVKATEKNLSELNRLRGLVQGDFERLPFGLQRQVVLQFLVELVVKADRRNLVATFRVPFDNAGVQLLTDEVQTALQPRATTKKKTDRLDAMDEASSLVPDGRSGKEWLPLLDAVRTWCASPSLAVRQQFATMDAMKRLVPDLGMSITHGDDWRQG